MSLIYKDNKIRTFFIFDYLVLLFILILVRLPIAFGFRQSVVWRFVYVLPIFLVSLKNFFVILKRERVHFHKPISTTLFLYLVLMVGSYFRTALSGNMPINSVFGNLMTWLIVLLFGFSLFILSNDKEQYLFRNGIIWAIFIYILINLFLILLGVNYPEKLYLREFPSLMLGYFNVEASRLIFPTSAGLNSFGIVAGMSVVSASILVAQSKNWIIKLGGILLFILSIIVLLLTDSRAILFFSTLISFFSLFMFIKFNSLIKYVPFIAPVIPIFIIFVLSIISPDISVSDSRSGSNLSTLSNRTVIWGYIIDEFSEFKSIHFIGFGFRGHIGSGVSESYSELFSSYVTANNASSHNMVLQSILDIGYLGFIVLTILLFQLLKRLEILYRFKPMDVTIRIYSCIILYLILVGSLEIVFSTDMQEVFIIFLLIISSTFFQNLSAKKKGIKSIF